MKFVVAPDSYKGSLTSMEVGETIAQALREEIPDCEVAVIPMADGGEGTVDAMVQSAGGTVVGVHAAGPFGRVVDTYFGIVEADRESVAIVEAANIFGLPMVPCDMRDPMNTTSRGMGEVILAALDMGIRHFVIGLGGSATNDGGLGMLIALGLRFRLTDGRLAEGFGRELSMLVEADLRHLDPRLKECSIRVASDVTNPLLGPTGASHVFGPQKGATAAQVSELEQGMSVYANLLEEELTLRLRDLPGAGAAGGLGFALMALGGEIIPGALVVEQVTRLRNHIERADWVITGEGRSDGQTLYGKLPFRIAQLARQGGKPTILISGSLGAGREALRESFAGCFATVPGPAKLEECLERAEENLYECARNVARLLAASAKK